MAVLAGRTPLIGRSQELAVLLAHLETAREKAGGTALLSGEAGIGKSRLVGETKANAERLGFQILEGACFEPDRSLPYAPILDLLRAVLVGRDAEDAAALLVILEDLHWSDDTSLELLLTAARRLVGHPVLLLLTYRSDEMHPSLSHLLAELDRHRPATDVRPARLTLAEAEAMIRAIRRQERPVRADVLNALYELTEGNPFFIEEVLKTLAPAEDIFYAGVWDPPPLAEFRVPHSIQDAVRRRLAQLSEAAKETLSLAAVAGRRFDFALLQDLTGREESELLYLIRELVAAQLVAEESADRFAFHHALTQQAVAAEMLAQRTDTAVQYVRPWLVNQAAGGFTRFRRATETSFNRVFEARP